MPNDPPIVDRICEHLFAVATHEKNAVRFSSVLDLPTRLVHITFVVAQSSLPDDLRAAVNPQVERNVAAFMDDLGIVCKAFDDADHGRAFQLVLTPELRGMSWDMILDHFNVNPPGRKKLDGK
jgi:hypothetical protein